MNYRSLLLLSALLGLSVNAAQAQGAAKVRFVRSNHVNAAMEAERSQQTKFQLQTHSTDRQNSEALNSNALKKQDDSATSNIHKI